VASAPVKTLLGKLPLRFEEARGLDGRNGVRYVARAGSYRLRLAPDGNWLEWRNPAGDRSASIHTRLVGANPATRLEAAEDLPGKVNYFVGGRQDWRTDVPGFARIRYRDIYPHIDLVFHGGEGRLEYDLVAAPGADPGQIRLDVDGQRSLRIDPSGDLVISADGGEIRWKRPEVYQESAAGRVPIDGRFAVVGKRTVRFVVGDYDRTRTLVIDPTLAYSTYLGGTFDEVARGIAADASGNVYLAGNTTSLNLPTTASTLQPNFRGSGIQNFGDGFVAKFNPAGALVYLTYLGGSGDDAASAIAVDSAGNAYVCGLTTSTNFPTLNAYQSQYGGSGGNGFDHSGDAFVAKLNPSGNALVYSTYLGGSGDDVATAIAIDASGNAYVAGATASRNFPATLGAYQTTMNGAGGEPVMPILGMPEWDPGDAFVAKFDPTGSKLLECTMLGGGFDDIALTIALDPTGDIYIGGYTISTNFPTTAGAFDTTFGGIEYQDPWFNLGDGFVAKFDPTLSKLLYSTYFGGAGDDAVNAIAVDSAGEVYMTGSTSSSQLKTSTGAFQPKYAGYLTLPPVILQLFGDAYVAKLNAAGSALLYFSYLGGSNNDAGTAIAIDSAGNAYVTGFTDSPNFPLAGGPFQSAFGGDGGGTQPWILFGDAFLAVVNPTATALLYSTFLGGSLDDWAYGVALDGKGNVYLTGNTLSNNFPVTSKAFQPAYGGGGPSGIYGGLGSGDAFYSVFTGLALGPTISSVSNAEGGSTTIAPNTWVSIFGTGLAPDSRIWQGSDFVNSQLPTALDGASVTMNGTPAYVYYISATQINVLTPPNLAAGSVQVVVTNGAAASAAFTVAAQSVSPSFFIFGSGPYVAAVHAHGSFPYIGPTTLYPGLSSPAAPGETIELYANGFGPITPAVTAGSASQVGNLPVLPVVTIGGVQATVIFAGLSGAPGEFQFNVTIPSSLAAGDAAISASYNGATTQSGTLITIQ
jgi:uncharacterized protein (TIGR03437 family)